LARTQWAPGAPALAAAARAVDAVVSAGESADVALTVRPAADAPRAAVQAITLGTLRWYLRVAPVIESLLAHPAGVPAPARALLAVAAHQIEYSRNAPEASVHAAVDAMRLIGATRLAGLANAVLRRFVAERAALFERADRKMPARTAHPAWLVEALCSAWPEQAATLLDANNVHPPMTLRVDLSRTTLEDYQGQLAAASIDSRTIQSIPTALALDRPMSIHEVPGFAEGVVSVQDAGAQLAARLLAARAGMRVLDACAAPGGKTGELLESLGEGADVTSVDVDPARVELIRENLARLKRSAKLMIGDLREPESFWDGRPFERILVDAPCSSTGVIRRHPDIKLLRRPSDIAQFAAVQVRILRAAAAMLAPGGRLLYSTCSVLPAENEEVVQQLLQEPGLTLVGLPQPDVLPAGALARGGGLQLLPGAQAGTDGFYYACLEKTTNGT
jgi:16S rRNA (cytosine967-C5)-methyltransferase